MRFDVSGPFTLKRHTPKKLITKETLYTLEEEMEDWDEGLSRACGCYVVATKAGRGFKPIYVGKSNKKTIAREALNASNQGKYNTELASANGTPVLFAIPLLTAGGAYRKPKRADGTLDSVDFLENWLIIKAIEKNKRLLNNLQTRFLRNLHVVGVFNAKPGEASNASRGLGRALGI